MRKGAPRLFNRLKHNPLLTPASLASTRADFEVLCTFNPGAVRCGKEIILLVRVAERPVPEPGEVATAFFDPDKGQMEVLRVKLDDPDLRYNDPRCFSYKGRNYLTSVSHLRVARSMDGDNFAFAPEPAIFPCTENETFGIEDPRVTEIGGTYYIAASVISDRGVAVALFATTDFRSFNRLSIMFTTHNKDVCIFPEKVRGMYVCRHRPEASMNTKPSIWTAYSPDLECWGRNQFTMGPRPGPDSWEIGRIGCGAPPVKTPEGWLEIYHGASAKGRYCLGAMLSDLDEPHRLISRSDKPVLGPEMPYEMQGLYGNCIFSNGLVADPDGRLTVYYGAADTVCAGAVSTVEEMVLAAKNKL